MFEFLKKRKNKDKKPDSDEAPPIDEAAPLKPSATAEPMAQSPKDSAPPAKVSFFSRLKASLSKTRAQLSDGLANFILGKKTIDETLLEEIETRLLLADVGIEATEAIIAHLTQGISRKTLNDPQAVLNALKKELVQILTPCEAPLSLTPSAKPYVVLVIGVNGSGKTTTIGKLAKQFTHAGQSVMLAAGDTYRAAAVEQLKIWGERNHVPVIAQHTGADSASVIYDALQAATARGADVLLADTAGRLHTRDNLMEELKKIKRVLTKLNPQAPQEVMLVLDATLGQNALAQAVKFHEQLGVTGISITKLDGTAKGGIIFALAKRLGLPFRFIGLGEGVDDLRPFEASAFVEALFTEDITN